MSELVTHLVADNFDQPEVSEAIEIYEKPVVTVRTTHADDNVLIVICCRASG